MQFITVSQTCLYKLFCDRKGIYKYSLVPWLEIYWAEELSPRWPMSSGFSHYRLEDSTTNVCLWEATSINLNSPSRSDEYALLKRHQTTTSKLQTSPSVTIEKSSSVHAHSMNQMQKNFKTSLAHSRN